MRPRVATVVNATSQLVNEPAMQDVLGWRMQLAQHALETEDATVAELAGRLGYQSEAASARALKRVMGTSPGAVRRRSERRPGSPIALAAAS
jgi:AraC-like DNA-binding protein